MDERSLVVKRVEIKPFGGNNDNDAKYYIEVKFSFDSGKDYPYREKGYYLQVTPIWVSGITRGYNMLGWSSQYAGFRQFYTPTKRYSSKTMKDFAVSETLNKHADRIIEALIKEYKLEKI